jgi:hypothetical protein
MVYRSCFTIATQVLPIGKTYLQISRLFTTQSRRGYPGGIDSGAPGLENRRSISSCGYLEINFLGVKVRLRSNVAEALMIEGYGFDDRKDLASRGEAKTIKCEVRHACQ